MVRLQKRCTKVYQEEVHGFFDQERIVKFVCAVESHKMFKPDFNLVFRHLISEIGELDGAVHFMEKWRDSALYPAHQEKMMGNIANELLDILFLTLYMADIFGVNLNASVLGRMDAIRKKYKVPVEE